MNNISLNLNLVTSQMNLHSLPENDLEATAAAQEETTTTTMTATYWC